MTFKPTSVISIDYYGDHGTLKPDVVVCQVLDWSGGALVIHPAAYDSQAFVFTHLQTGYSLSVNHNTFGVILDRAKRFWSVLSPHEKKILQTSTYRSTLMQAINTAARTICKEE